MEDAVPSPERLNNAISAYARGWRSQLEDMNVVNMPSRFAIASQELDLTFEEEGYFVGQTALVSGYAVWSNESLVDDTVVPKDITAECIAARQGSLLGLVIGDPANTGQLDVWFKTTIPNEEFLAGQPGERTVYVLAETADVMVVEDQDEASLSLAESADPPSLDDYDEYLSACAAAFAGQQRSGSIQNIRPTERDAKEQEFIKSVEGYLYGRKLFAALHAEYVYVAEITRDGLRYRKIDTDEITFGGECLPLLAVPLSDLYDGSTSREKELCMTVSIMKTDQKLLETDCIAIIPLLRQEVRIMPVSTEQQ